MFTDPQSVTISGSAISLPRTSSEEDGSEYTSADGTVKLTVTHSQAGGGRFRRLFRIDHQKLAADPFRPSENRYVSMSFYMVTDVPEVGYTVAEAKAVIDGFIAALNASSGALITRYLGGES